MLGEQLVADQAYGFEVQIDRVQVEQRGAEFIGGGQGNVTGAGRAAGHQLGDDADLAFARSVDRLEHCRLFDNAILYQPLGQAAEARARGAER